MFEYNVKIFGNLLYIDNAISENQGVYMCNVDDMPDVSPIPVYITVNPKKFEYSPQEVTVKQNKYFIPAGESLSVECKPRGYPLPMVKWRRVNIYFICFLNLPIKLIEPTVNRIYVISITIKSK